MSTKYCKDCTHYIQHYYFRGRGFSKVDCGHCMFPRIKSRKPNSFACSHYQRKYPDELAP